MDIIDDYKQLQIIDTLKEYNNMKVCYKENLKLCKWQKQQINRLATAIEKIDKILKVYFDDDNKATREIKKLLKNL